MTSFSTASEFVTAPAVVSSGGERAAGQRERDG
jgi:hypothetical protein